MLDDSTTYSTGHGAVGVQMAVNLESDGKRFSQETAEQRQKRLQNVRERILYVSIPVCCIYVWYFVKTFNKRILNSEGT
jgi:hypothetical protein